ncbi:hypothetical protein [Azospirillum soli]|uniref:hypothetical protein n=1 Tax=Azospirillum soli TaxID=1304799 RepID=UPI001AE367E0|nr:hypothetical protein [Azospirillum soli]MBP2312622.1 hypothetical protein [Azospirillum soli]
MRELQVGDRVKLNPKVVGEKWPALFKKFAETGRMGTVISVPTTTVQFDVKRAGAKPAIEVVPDAALLLID